MRTSRGSVMTVVVFSLALLSASDVSAIGCWVCQHALDTCFYYRRTGLEDCASGCNRMYPLNSPAWHGCRQACQAEYNAGTSQCQDEYDYCTDGCMQDEDTGPRENCPIVLDLGRHNWHFTSAAAGVRSISTGMAGPSKSPGPIPRTPMPSWSGIGISTGPSTPGWSSSGIPRCSLRRRGGMGSRPLPYWIGSRAAVMETAGLRRAMRYGPP
jgi:hypothetical protein